jgi:hypothetical protein
MIEEEFANNRLLSYLPTRGGLAKRRGGTLAHEMIREKVV